MAEYCRDACAETGGVEQDERLDPYAKVWSAKPVLSQTSTSFLTRSQSETISMPGSYLALIGSTVLHTSPMSLSISTMVATPRSGPLTVTIHTLATGIHAVLSSAHASAKKSVGCEEIVNISHKQSRVVNSRVRWKITRRY
jgi:hypothetical protein